MGGLIAVFAAVSVVLGIVGAVIVIADIRNGHRQRMPVMEVVWPLTVLWASWIGVILYFRFGRQLRESSMEELMNTDMRPNRPMVGMAPADMAGEMAGTPMVPMGTGRVEWRGVLLSALHCGAGCALADVVGEGFTGWVPLTLAGSAVAAQWTLDYVLALLFGVGFQYAAMQQMGREPAGMVLKRAVKADFLSLTAWQFGMYGWMALVLFVFFPEGLPKSDWTFWFMLQIGMLAGLGVSFPVNRWLIGAGIKHSM